MWVWLVLNFTTLVDALWNQVSSNKHHQLNMIYNTPIHYSWTVWLSGTRSYSFQSSFLELIPYHVYFKPHLVLEWAISVASRTSCFEVFVTRNPASLICLSSLLAVSWSRKDIRISTWTTQTINIKITYPSCLLYDDCPRVTLLTGMTPVHSADC